jgi:hypothetical protein
MSPLEISKSLIGSTPKKKAHKGITNIVRGLRSSDHIGQRKALHQLEELSREWHLNRIMEIYPADIAGTERRIKAKLVPILAGMCFWMVP